MGMSASQVRLLTLTARLSDLELEAQMISNSKIRLAIQTEGITKTYVEALQGEDQTKLNLATALYTAQVTQIQSEDKIFDLSLKQVETEHSAIQTEYDSVKKIIDKNVERSFKIFG